MQILVVGGAGYIGSHMVKMLSAEGHDVITFDNLVAGFRDAVIDGRFISGDLNDPQAIEQVFVENEIDAVMHFASHIQVGESIQDPAKYYENNVSNTLNLLNAMVKHDVLKFIFSSTAAIFGEPEYVPIDEEHPKQPINPYGMSKLMIEHILKDFDRAYNFKSVCLRYFNAAGADPEGELGERHQPETHLIPLILQAASGRRDSIKVFGNDYNTPDGTCIRDYIHIVDLCQAHYLALEQLLDGADSMAFNLGNGNGYSINEVVAMVKQVTGRDFKVEPEERRAGDPASLVADSTAARAELGWNPMYADLESIVQHAWNWEVSHFKQ